MQNSQINKASEIITKLISCFDFSAIPLFGGALLTATDGESMRGRITLALIGIMILLIVLEALGRPIGEVGKMALTAFPLLLGYWFGIKETEAKQQKI